VCSFVARGGLSNGDKTPQEKPAANCGVEWMSAIKEERLRWLWPGYNPHGNVDGSLTAIRGLGKSTIAYDSCPRD